MDRKRLFFFAKLIISVGILAWLWGTVIERQGVAELTSHLSSLSWGWLVVAVLMQLCAITCSVVRWDKLLVGQGIHAPFRYLYGAFMIGRFFGEFAPGGWTGRNGYRVYDLTTRTGKLARATASMGIEMVLGWMSFGAVVLFGSFFGLRFIGLKGVLLVDSFFFVTMVAAIVLVTKPALFRFFAARAPKQIEGKLRTTVDAVCAYEGKGNLVTQSALLGIGTHVFRARIYVAAARALAAPLGIGEVFFGSSLQIFATLMPASINGIGLREATAVALYTRVGTPEAIAVLIPTLGYLVEISFSIVGGLIFAGRRVGYSVDIRVDNPEHEEAVHAALEKAPKERWPKLGRGLSIGAGAGLLGGALLGLAEGAAILHGSNAAPDYGVLVYGALAYGLLLCALGAGMGLFFALSGRLMQREALPESLAYARIAALLPAFCGLAIGAFRIRRDVYHEELVWKSLAGLALLGKCVLAATVSYFVLSFVLRKLTERTPLRVLLRSWGTPALLVCALAPLVLVAFRSSAADAKLDLSGRKAANPTAGNILFVVVDTLRADHLPGYGYASGKTPNLETFARDAVRFDQAFANASWTRPSFASMLTGRYASSHRVMSKSDSLPSEIVTLPEALQSAGYSTAGIVTNFNVAPFFNFHQGFDAYRYLEPNFVLGANDTAAKLLFVQFLRQRMEKMHAAKIGSAYQPAPIVNAAILETLDQEPRAPWFLFAGYMDPHDPYYTHPYDGTAYSRAANQHPDASEAPRLRKLYDGEITFWDESFGALVAELKKRGVYDDMTIVITSDHGEEFMDHGGYWHGTTLYDEQVRVPLYVKLPGNDRGGSVVRHWVQSIDLMPSLLERAGVDVPKGVQGSDVFVGHEAVFAEESHEGNVLRSLRMQRAGTQVKLITANEGNPRGLATQELYRVDQDAPERLNLANDEPALTEFAHKALNETEKNAQQGRAAQKSVDVGADANAAAKLRALGYAGGDTDHANPATPAEADKTTATADKKL
jgi:arylsulfatase A-like enzyme/uncharacterized membrane protein YbhN (UPF0104 family)